MVTSLKTREKKKLIDSLLAGDHVLIHLGPQEPGVTLPVHLMSNHTVTLKLSRHFRGALTLHADHIETHLLFGQAYFQCRIPYEAIWGVTSENGETSSWLEGFLDDGRTSTKQTPPPATAPSSMPAAHLQTSDQFMEGSFMEGSETNTHHADLNSERKNSIRSHLSLQKLENSSGTTECDEDSEENELDQQITSENNSESKPAKGRPKLVRIK